MPSAANAAVGGAWPALALARPRRGAPADPGSAPAQEQIASPKRSAGGEVKPRAGSPLLDATMAGVSAEPSGRRAARAKVLRPLRPATEREHLLLATAAAVASDVANDDSATSRLVREAAAATKRSPANIFADMDAASVRRRDATLAFAHEAVRPSILNHPWVTEGLSPDVQAALHTAFLGPDGSGHKSWQELGKSISAFWRVACADNVAGVANNAYTTAIADLDTLMTEHGGNWSAVLRGLPRDDDATDSVDDSPVVGAKKPRASPVQAPRDPPGLGSAPGVGATPVTAVRPSTSAAAAHATISKSVTKSIAAPSSASMASRAAPVLRVAATVVQAERELTAQHAFADASEAHPHYRGPFTASSVPALAQPELHRPGKPGRPGEAASYVMVGLERAIRDANVVCLKSSLVKLGTLFLFTSFRRVVPWVVDWPSCHVMSSA